MKNRYYLWEGMTSTGEWVSGRLMAPNRLYLSVYLMKQQIVVKKSHCLTPFYRKRSMVSSASLTQLLYQLHLLLQAGLPLIDSLTALAKQRHTLSVQLLLHELIDSLKGGTSLAESLTRYAQAMSPLEVSLIQAGESSGTLLAILEHLVTYRLDLITLKQTLKQALYYPVMLITTGVVIMLFMCMNIIPQFKQLFVQMGVSTPYLTWWVFQCAFYIEIYWKTGSFLMIMMVALLYGAYVASHVIQEKVHQCCLACPFLKGWLRGAVMIQLAKRLAILGHAGIPLHEALGFVSKTLYWRPYQKAIKLVQTSIASGMSIHQSMLKSPLFPTIAIQMIALGESSGELEKMLEKTAFYYEQAMQNALKRLSTLIEPVMIGLLGVIVGGLVIAVYLPIFQLGSVF